MRTRNIDKEQLVKQTAIEMLVDEGMENFSVNKLAKACGISVATLYIYYKDKNDLITSIAVEEAKRMSEFTLRDFDPEVSFEEGLRLQWKNRAAYVLENPKAMLMFEQLRSSSYDKEIFQAVTEAFRSKLGKFMRNAIERGEIDELPMEVYWSVAFAPLYNLLRFHNEKRSIGGHPFTFSEKIMWHTFSLVVKALKK